MMPPSRLRRRLTPHTGMILVALMLALTPPRVLAHGPGGGGDEADLPPAPTASTSMASSAAQAPPRWRFGVHVALAQLDADDALPAPRLPGVLDTGIPPEDARQHTLEQGRLHAGLRWNAHWAAAVAAAWHGANAAADQHRPRTDTAWLQWRSEDGAHRLQVGRQAPARGAVLSEGGPAERWLFAPLALRSTLGSDDPLDGLQWHWLRDTDTHAPGWRWHRLDVGAWRSGQRFPAGSDSPPHWQLHPQWQWAGDLTADAWATRLSIRQRGQQLTPTNGAHTHQVPGCQGDLSQLACFDGRAWLSGASLRWAPETQPWWIAAAWMSRREDGQLATTDGQGTLRSRTEGHWLDLGWRWHPTWTARLRWERAAPRHTLSGPGATLVAQQTGLNTPHASRRLASQLRWDAHPQLQLLGEIGRESRGADITRFAALRLVWGAFTDRPSQSIALQ